MSVIFFIIGLIIGFGLGYAMMFYKMVKDPIKTALYVSLYNNMQPKQKDNRPSYYVYVEFQDDTYYVYGSERNNFEAMDSSEQEALNKVCEKYPEYQIMVVNTPE